ncbi:MAG TPA: class I SAM-dependent methyltransferase [Deltaproteobacteria bacterium]|nr:class I SAM-dependent methyltransferase [Deltaproteobacteria bacterium]
MIFDAKTAQSYDDWLTSPVGYYITGRQQKLILDLLAPQEGETMLDVGCKSGQFLLFFRRHGCNVTGIDPSPAMIDLARKKLGHRADLYQGNVHDLPFSDNEFDVVSLITSLEFYENPQRVIEESIRVARNRIVIGFLNRYSLVTESLKADTIFRHASNTFGIFELRRLIRGILSETTIHWGSVIFFPIRWYPSFSFVEEWIPRLNNPLGSFGGCVFPMVYTRHTIQEPLKDSLKVGVR